jgi:hypothetical protein
VYAIVLDHAWKVCLVIFIIQDFHDVLGSITCTHWFLGQAGVLLEHPENARLELHNIDILHGQEVFINGDVLFFEVQHSA